MVVDYKELKKVVDSARFESWERFSFSGLDYLLFPGEYTEEEREAGESPVFFQGSSIADWDIYFGMNAIEERFRKSVLLHEIVESSYWSKLIEKNGELSDIERIESHRIACEYDKKYAKETFSEKNYSDYCAFLDRIRG